MYTVAAALDFDLALFPRVLGFSDFTQYDRNSFFENVLKFLERRPGTKRISISLCHTGDKVLSEGSSSVSLVSHWKLFQVWERHFTKLNRNQG